MTTTSLRATGDLLALLPRELAAELLDIAREKGADFAEVYGEQSAHTGFSYEENRLKTSSYSVTQGVGVRAVIGDQTGYAYADGFAPGDLREAARVAARIARGAPANGRPRAFRVVEAPWPFRLERPAPLALDEHGKIALVERANHTARAHDPRIHEVSVSLGDSSKSFVVANSEGLWADDRQFLSRLTVSALALEGSERQEGYATGGGSVEAGYFERERRDREAREELPVLGPQPVAVRDQERLGGIGERDRDLVDARIVGARGVVRAHDHRDLPVLVERERGGPLEPERPR